MAKQIGVPSLSVLPLAKNPFVDVTCRVFIVGERETLMLITNTASLYSLLAPANGLKNREQFGCGLIRYLEQHLLVDGFREIFMQYVPPELETMLFTKSLNRSVTGSMTDMVKLVKFMLIEDSNNLDHIAAKLNETPFKALDYGQTREHFAALAA